MKKDKQNTIKKVLKINKLDFGVSDKRDFNKNTSIKKQTKIKPYTKIFLEKLNIAFKYFKNFINTTIRFLLKLKREFSRNIFLGRGVYFKYISNFALLIIVLFGTFAYLYVDKANASGFLSKYSGMNNISSAGFMSMNTQSLVQQNQFAIVQHTVASGETLSEISARYSTSDNVITVDSIMWANGLKSSDVLKTNMVLDIPPVSGVVHTIQKNETVVDIAKKYKLIDEKSSSEEVNGATQKIVDINSLSVAVTQADNGNEIRTPQVVEGDRLIIPGGIIEAPKPTPTQAPRVVIQQARPPQYTNIDIGPNGFGWPVAGGVGLVTQRYSSYHTALDIASNASPNLVAMGNGVVVKAGWSDSICGNTVHIQMDNGFKSIYCHMNSVEGYLLGQRVVAGQVVGRMGTTGVVTGMHVHMALSYNNSWVNPCAYAPFIYRC